MKSDIWEVEYKGSIANNSKYEEDLTEEDLEEGEEDETDYELSVIKKDNKFGHSSWGWGGDDKIIIFTSLDGNPCDGEDETRALKIANTICDALNAAGIE